MQIHGFEKLTLLDYPGYMACTLFLGGCNFRCPFCQNKGLVLAPHREPVIDSTEILAYLKKRQGVLEGVCITGGEPTLEAGLKDFLREIRSLGYRIKLDTNGSRPDIIEDLWQARLVDYIAMDIKSSPQNYPLVSGIPGLLVDPVLESVAFLMSGSIDYEFRTTVVKELHTVEDMIRIVKWLRGCRRYYLQPYKDSDNVLIKGFSSPLPETLEHYRSLLLPDIPQTHIRSI